MTTTLGREPADAVAPGARWTVQEIAQQPRLWREVAATLTARREETEAFLAPLLALPDLRVLLCGAGTSAFAGELLAPALTRELGRRVEAVATTDVVADPRGALGQDVPTLVVSFARSGDSPESTAATRLATAHLTRCWHLVVTCSAEGSLFADHHGDERSLTLLMPAEANDRGFAMTSSFTCMVLATLLVLRRSAPDAAAVERLATAAEGVLATVGHRARALAAAGHRRVVYLGSGPLRGLARESALKLLELTAGRVVAYHDSPLGFRHGPKAVLDDSTLVVLYVSGDPYTRRYDADIAAELTAALPPGQLVVVAAAPFEEGAAGTGVVSWPVTGVGDVDDAALALPYVLCAQLLALHTSLALGLTPDDPFPSHLVNRVVQGVTIHPYAG